MACSAAPSCSGWRPGRCWRPGGHPGCRRAGRGRPGGRATGRGGGAGRPRAGRPCADAPGPWRPGTRAGRSSGSRAGRVDPVALQPAGAEAAAQPLWQQVDPLGRVGVWGLCRHARADQGLHPVEVVVGDQGLVGGLLGEDPGVGGVPAHAAHVAGGDVVDVQQDLVAALLVPDLVAGVARVAGLQDGGVGVGLVGDEDLETVSLGVGEGHLVRRAGMGPLAAADRPGPLRPAGAGKVQAGKLGDPGAVAGPAVGVQGGHEGLLGQGQDRLLGAAVAVEPDREPHLG
jgi:hypothetical protein